jgi:hypothetical protein
MGEIDQLPPANCFKVVRIQHGKKLSYISKSEEIQSKRFKGCEDKPCKLVIEYFQHVTVYPKVGKILVFKNWEATRELYAGPSHIGEPFETWACYGTDLEPIDVLLYPDYMNANSVIKFWNNETITPIPSARWIMKFQMNAPKNTLGASSLMLLHKVN